MTPIHLKSYVTSIRLPRDLRPRIHAAAAADSRGVAEWMREAVRDALAKAEAVRQSPSPTDSRD